jgi:hypothetical protein
MLKLEHGASDISSSLYGSKHNRIRKDTDWLELFAKVRAFEEKM